MANISITNLPAVTSVSGTDSLPIVQSGISYRATISQLASFVQQAYPAPGVSSIATTGPITGGPITSTGTIGLQTAGVTNAYLGTMANNTIKGNNSGGAASPSDLTTAQVMTMLGAAPLASPTFTGTPAAPTPSTSDSSTTIATTAYVKAQGYGTGSVTSVAAGAGLSGGTITTTGTISLPTTGVTAATYGSSSAVPVFTVDTYGRVTGVTNTNISTSAIGAVPTSRTISTSGGISGGGDLTSDRTLSLTPIANNTLLGNTSGSSASPSSTTLTAIMDATFGNQQGDVVYRAGSLWTTLTPGTAGQLLATGGSGANPYWASVTGTGTVLSIGAGTGLSSSTTNPITTSGTLSIANTTVSAGTYGSGTQVATFTVNAQGQLTNAANTSIGIAASQVTSGNFNVGQGGTGATSFTQYGVLYGNNTSAIQVTAAGTTGQILIGNSSSAPTWSSSLPSGFAVTSFSGGSTGLTPNSATTGAVTLGGVLGSTYGGTGVNNGSSTITLGGNLTTSGAFNTTFTVTNNTSVTLPTSGTLVNTAVTTLSSLSSIGTVTAGTWNASVITGTYGGTGVNNGSNTITLGGNLTTSGAFNTTLTATASTSVTLPTSGTLISSVTALSGAVTGTPSATTYLRGDGTWATTGTVTSVSFTGGIISVATATTTPALTVAGTSGGIPYFSSGTTWASSAALAANAIVLGGGAGAAPATTTTGTGVVTAIGNNVNTTNGLATGSVTTLSSLSSVGTIGTGTWNGSIIGGTYGGTGVNNGASTITIGGNLTFSGAFTTSFTVSGNTSLTLPTSGTVTALGNSSTGSGSIVLATSPNLTTPNIGAATATSVTGPTIYGGTGTGSSLTLQSTTGIGATDSIVMKVGNNGATTALSIATTGIVSFPTTGAIVLPVGTTAQEPTGQTGMLRFNTSTTAFEGYNGTAWTSVGGGAAGGGTDQIFYLNGQTVTTNYSIPSGQNAGTFGPVTVNSGVTVTVPSGSTWSIV